MVVGCAVAFLRSSALVLQPVKGEGEFGKRFTVGLTGLWGYFYLGWLPAFLLALSVGKSPGLDLIVGIGVALSDVGAFCIGKSLGCPKLSPHLSPCKSWSGVLGNLLVAALAFILACFALPYLL